MEANARHCAKTCFIHLRRIRQLRRCVDHDALYTLIRALILSRLDYCNSLFVCSSQSTLHREEVYEEEVYSSVRKMLLLDFSVVLLPGRMHHLS